MTHHSVPLPAGTQVTWDGGIGHGTILAPDWGSVDEEPALIGYIIQTSSGHSVSLSVGRVHPGPKPYPWTSNTER